MDLAARAARRGKVTAGTWATTAATTGTRVVMVQCGEMAVMGIWQVAVAETWTTAAGTTKDAGMMSPGEAVAVGIGKVAAEMRIVAAGATRVGTGIMPPGRQRKCAGVRSQQQG